MKPADRRKTDTRGRVEHLRDRAKIARTATDLVLVLVQLGVRRTVLAHLLLTLEARPEKVVRLETLQTDSAGSGATRRLCGLCFPVNRQIRFIYYLHGAESIFRN
jgi:hypothetical protein